MLLRYLVPGLCLGTLFDIRRMDNETKKSNQEGDMNRKRIAAYISGVPTNKTKAFFKFMPFGASKFLLWIMLILSTLSSVGCAETIAYHIARKVSLGDEYAQFKNTSGPIKPGFGRVIVYFPGGGPNILNTYGHTRFCTIDKDIYRLLGESFWSIDVPVGKHRITAQEVEPVYIRNTLRPTEPGEPEPEEGRWKYWSFGKFAVELDIREKETKYCRIEGASGILKPAIVDPGLAEIDLTELSFYKESKIDRKIGDQTLRP